MHSIHLSSLHDMLQDKEVKKQRNLNKYVTFLDYQDLVVVFFSTIDLKCLCILNKYILSTRNCIDIIFTCWPKNKYHMEPNQTLKWKKQTAGSVGKCMWESWNLGSSFASDLLRGWQGFFRPTTRKVKKKTIPVCFQHLIDNCSIWFL